MLQEKAKKSLEKVSKEMNIKLEAKEQEKLEKSLVEFIGEVNKLSKKLFSNKDNTIKFDLALKTFVEFYQSNQQEILLGDDEKVKKTFLNMLLAFLAILNKEKIIKIQ